MRKKCFTDLKENEKNLFTNPHHLICFEKKKSLKIEHFIET